MSHWLSIVWWVDPQLLGKLAGALPAGNMATPILETIQAYLRPSRDIVNTEAYRRDTLRRQFKLTGEGYLGLGIPTLVYLRFEDSHHPDDGMIAVVDMPLPPDLRLLVREYIRYPLSIWQWMSLITWTSICTQIRAQLQCISEDESRVAERPVVCRYPICYVAHMEETLDRSYLSILWKLVRLGGYQSWRGHQARLACEQCEYSVSHMPALPKPGDQVSQFGQVDRQTLLSDQEQQLRITELQLLFSDEDVLTLDMEAPPMNLRQACDQLGRDYRDLTVY
jgi:hypothetical protein